MENLNISASKLQIPTRLKLKDVFLKLKKLTLTIVFYTLITNTITLGHFTLSNFKWQISQNSRNIKNHWNFNLDHIILTRRVGRIFTLSCYKIKCQIIKLRSVTFSNSQIYFPDENVKKVRNSKLKLSFRQKYTFDIS